MIKFKRDDYGISEDVKITITVSIQKFVDDDQHKELEFPSSLTSKEREFIHTHAAQLGLKTKSRGKGFNRYLTIYKKEGSTIVQSDATFKFGRLSQSHIISLIQRHPLTDKERKELMPLSERDRSTNASFGHFEMRELNCTTGRLNSVIPQIPAPPPYASGHSDEYTQFRQNLPIWRFRNDVMQLIANNSVVLITGETGCGKTTQVPQFILEYCHFSKMNCRIICTEPRRIAALSVAERVSAERGESIGQTVGYQIRLESRGSPRTLLTFCTNGVLLRTLMGGDDALSTVTHVIIDEIHERDRFSDFLILIMRDMLKKYPKLKLILMSATFDTQRFINYFGSCPTIHVLGSCYDVEYYFLEDILKMTGHMTPAMRRYKELLSNKNSKQKSLVKWCEEVKVSQETNTASDVDVHDNFDVDLGYNSQLSDAATNLAVDRDDIDSNLKMRIDYALRNAWVHGTDEAFFELIDLIVTERIPADFQHSETGVTALICATCHGKVNMVETLLNYGASITLCTPNDWDALSWAKYFHRTEIAELLEAYWKCSDNVRFEEKYEALADSELTEQEKEILDIYHRSFNDEHVDADLIASLLHMICVKSEMFGPENPKGAVLIFLPGYDEIVRLREIIINDQKRFDANKYVLFTLHSQMQSSDQKRVFKRVPSDVRKIILSTNISETSITIDDVVFVIDSGKVKEKSYDANMGASSLKSVWISQSSAVQRRGRAGRCRNGVCFHMFSKVRFLSMQKHQIPEILRIPIHELCLQTKLLAPPNMSIAEFLAKAPEPPSMAGVKSSAQLLNKIDALDSFEQLTELGLHLLDLPVEPNLGKMILYSVVLKCLDPVLTIVCSLAYRDPFMIPSAHASKKRTAAAVKKKLSSGTFSDHMILLRGFQAWQKARHDGNEKAFCEQNFIGSATMEMIVGMRAQLLGQLRASGFVRARGAGDIRDLNTNSENWAVVKAALCAGSYPNLIRVDRDRKQLVTQREVKVRFHPTSVLNSDPLDPKENIYGNRTKHVKNLPSDWIIYEEMIRIGRISYARCCTLISPITVALFAGPSRLSQGSIVMCEPNMDSDSESEEKCDRSKSIFKLDNWISFHVDPDNAQLAYNLRQKWHSLFLRRMSSPSKPLSQSDESVIKAIVDVLSVEEATLGFHQPVGIGQRPRPMSTDFCPPFSNVSLSPSPIGKPVFYSSRQRSSPRQQQQLSRGSPRYVREYFNSNAAKEYK